MSQCVQREWVIGGGGLYGHLKGTGTASGHPGVSSRISPHICHSHHLPLLNYFYLFKLNTAIEHFYSIEDGLLLLWSGGSLAIQPNQ